MITKNKVIGLLLIGLVLIVSKALVVPKFESFIPKGPRPDFALVDVKIAYFNKGKKQWHLNAATAEIDKTTHLGTFSQVVGIFQTETNPAVQLSAPKMRMELETGKLIFEHVVAVWNILPYPLKISGERFVWDDQLKEFNGFQNIILDHPDYKLCANNIRLELNKERLTFYGGNPELTFKKI